MNKALFLLSLFLLCSFRTEEDAFAALKSALDRYADTREYSFDYVLRLDCLKGDGSKTVRGSFLRKGNDYLLQQGADKTIQSSGYAVHINDRDKVIIVQRSMGEMKFNELFGVFDLEREYVSAKMSSNDLGQLLTFSSKDDSPLSYADYSHVQLNKAGWIHSVTVHYNTRAQSGSIQVCTDMSLNYSEYVIGKVDSSPLNLSNYVKISGDKVTATAPYSSYQVISSLKYEKE